MLNEDDDKATEPAKKSSQKATNSQGQKMSSAQGLGGHRLHRSAVRPFFCCGSQLSLNSIPDFVDVPSQESEITDLSDSDEVSDLMSDMSVNKHTGSRNVQDRSYRHKDKNIMRKKFWTIKLRGKLHVPKRSRFPASDQNLRSGPGESSCECTSYRRTLDNEEITLEEEPSTSSGTPLLIEYDTATSKGAENVHCESGTFRARPQRFSAPELDTPSSEVIVTFRSRINFDELYPTEDVDERRIAERAREMEEGIDMSDFWVTHDILGATGGGSPTRAHVRLVPASSEASFMPSTAAILRSLSMNSRHSGCFDQQLNADTSCYGECNFTSLPQQSPSSTQSGEVPPLPLPRYFPSHSQVDFMHCLVPDILHITKCSFYWGVMDRYQAEKLLENKPEGTFLLRDSAQEEFLFSVSFRRYGRSLHARIEQWNHKFSFDSHDPGVFASDTVCGLIEHYKDPTCCMFFEPMLTSPLHRNFPFSLQHMCRATICDNTTYDGISMLPLPRSLKAYLMYYHYKQKVRVRRFDTN